MEEEAGMPPALPRKHVDVEDTEYFAARIRFLEKKQEHSQAEVSQMKSDRDVKHFDERIAQMEAEHKKEMQKLRTETDNEKVERRIKELEDAELKQKYS